MILLSWYEETVNEWTCFAWASELNSECQKRASSHSLIKAQKLCSDQQQDIRMQIEYTRTTHITILVDLAGPSLKMSLFFHVVATVAESLINSSFLKLNYSQSILLIRKIASFTLERLSIHALPLFDRSLSNRPHFLPFPSLLCLSHRSIAFSSRSTSCLPAFLISLARSHTILTSSSNTQTCDFSN